MTQRQIELAEDGVWDWAVQRVHGPFLPPYLHVVAIQGTIGDLVSWGLEDGDGTMRRYIVTTLSRGHDTSYDAYQKLKEIEAGL